MKTRFGFVFAFAALLFFGQAGVAQAALCPSYTSCSVSDVTGAEQAASNIDFNAYATGGSRYSIQGGAAGDPLSSLILVNASITKGNKTSGAFEHVRPQGVGRHQDYLAVFGGTRHDFDGFAILTFNPGITTVAFEWGSIDSFNSFTVLNGAGQHYTISGSALLESLMADTSDGLSKYFSLTDLAGIKSIIFKSGYDAFEVASMSAVPLPAALPLFGAALGGLFVARRRKRAA